MFDFCLKFLGCHFLHVKPRHLDLARKKVLCGLPQASVLTLLDIFSAVQLQIYEQIGVHVKNVMSWDFPGGPVVKNLPSSAGDAGSIPGWGTKIPPAAGQLSPRAATKT